MSEHLNLNVDKAVFNLKDKKVEALRHAGMSLEAFALLIRPEDPYILIGNTIYAYTEQEFYAIRAVMPMTELSDAMFDYVINLEDTGYMAASDRAFLEDVRKKAEKCTACQYKRYKNEVLGIVKKYGIELPEDIGKDIHPMPGEYPETTGHVPPLVFAMLDHMYSVPTMQRKACMDCVEKHMAQAYVLSRECAQGYPEHITYVIGHLCEAIDELPKELIQLKQTLEFCLAKTNYERRPFVPLGALVGHLHIGRMNNKHETDDAVPVPNPNFELDMTDAMAAELEKLPEELSKRLYAICTDIDDKFTLEVRNSENVVWKGRMACAADAIADFAPLTANMIRARRLVYGAAPELMAEAGHGMKTLCPWLKCSRTSQSP